MHQWGLTYKEHDSHLPLNIFEHFFNTSCKHGNHGTGIKLKLVLLPISLVQMLGKLKL